jgi:hypothetical protein
MIAVVEWFKAAQIWALKLELREIDKAKSEVNQSLDALKQEILSKKRKEQAD